MRTLKKHQLLLIGLLTVWIDAASAFFRVIAFGKPLILMGDWFKSSQCLQTPTTRGSDNFRATTVVLAMQHLLTRRRQSVVLLHLPEQQQQHNQNMEQEELIKNALMRLLAKSLATETPHPKAMTRIHNMCSYFESDIIIDAAQ
jgi:hypothetical protein